MKTYPPEYNPIREYWAHIQSGEAVVGQKVYKTFRHLIRQLDAPGIYFYDARRGNHILEFAENFCRHSKGKYGGQLVRLELWEKAILAAIFGFVDIEGVRQYRQAVLIIGKKNGKSLLSSIVGAYMLTADGEAGPEVYAVATKRDQARIIWTEAKRMIKKSPVLQARVRTLVNELLCDSNDGVFKPLASDYNSLDGLNVHCALMDEFHQWQHGRPLYDIIADGVIAREQPLLFLTSTAGMIREDIYDDIYDECERLINGYDDLEGYRDEHMIAFVYELDQRAEWTDPRCWMKANPGLGTIKSRRILEDKVEKAKANPALVRNLVCKEFNIRETDISAWLNFEELNNTDTFTLDREARQLRWTHNGEERILSYPRYGIGGVDLSKTTDLCAAKVLFRVPEAPEITFVLSQYWLPEQPSLEQLETETKIPWTKWAERDLLRCCPGNIIRYRDVVDWFVYVQEELDIYVSWFGYDAWSASYFVEDMGAFFGSAAGVAVHQGKKTLSDPMMRLGAELRAHRIVYNNNPLDKWCLANTTYEEDKNGNIQPHKTNRPTRKIDGTAALLDAWVVMVDRMQDYLNLI
jgi:phage terminase large subunit-like protein